LTHASEAAHADSFEAAASAHMPSWMKMCEGMWRAWCASGAISA
jgi:hypothetical protein